MLCEFFCDYNLDLLALRDVDYVIFISFGLLCFLNIGFVPHSIVNMIFLLYKPWIGRRLFYRSSLDIS